MSIQNGLPLAEREPDEGPGLDDQQQSALESFGVARVQSDRYVVTSLPQLARWEAPCHSLGLGMPVAARSPRRRLRWVGLAGTPCAARLSRAAPTPDRLA